MLSAQLQLWRAVALRPRWNHCPAGRLIQPLRQFYVNWSTPTNTTLSGPTNIPVAAFSPACNGGTCIPQAGTSQQLDSLGDRLGYRLAYRNLGDHQALVLNHSITA